MTMATTDAPTRLAEMGRREAEEVTQAIKDNFDSVGAMLAQARDRKAYKALGYRSFESYCQSEFGKSISTAYQLIEDAKVISELEARISEKYGEEVTLNFPASHLKPLKEIADTDDKLRAIEYAQKLAEAENRKATKKDLEIAVFHVSGKRSEDFRGAIQSLGFSRGVQVEVSKSLNQDRGFVTKIDKGGKVYVEFHYGGNAAIPYDAADLRILSEDEQPAKPLTDDITNKGDRVLIFSPALKGKEGTIFLWKSGKNASVIVDGRDSPIDIAYAEMELIKSEQKNADWESELVWESGKNTYYYFPQENKIYSNRWPTGLTLTPYTHSGNPIDFVAHWENQFSHSVLESLATPATLEKLVIQQVIELLTDEGRKFATDLIDCLQQFLPQNDTSETAALLQENQRLREQLAEAEAAIQAIVNVASTASPLGSPEASESLENAQEWRQILEANYFIPVPFKLDGDFKGHWRGWNFFFHHPNGGVIAIDLINNKEEKFTRCTEHNFNIDLDNENEIIKWVRQVINQVEDFCPGQLSLFPSAPYENSTIYEAEAKAAIQAIENTSETSSPRDTAAHSDFLAENNSIFSKKRERILKSIAQEKEAISKTNDQKKLTKFRNNIRNLEGQLEDLDKFEKFKVGDIITKTRFPEKKGILKKIEITPTGMPVAWVEWHNEYEEEHSTPEQHPLGVLENLSIQDEEEK